MFKDKRYTSLLTILTLYSNNPTNFYTNKLNANLVFVRTSGVFNYPSLLLLTDVLFSFSVDVAATTNNSINKVTTNNLFYNYKFDTYLSVINSKNIQGSLTCFFFNRGWLEREVCEFFDIKFTSLADTRPLLSNYNENVKSLSKLNNLQPSFDLRTVWHSRKITKFKGLNVEL